jgi:hypothetical protein
MGITQLSLAQVLRQHVTLEVESIDRMYLNVYLLGFYPLTFQLIGRRPFQITLMPVEPHIIDPVLFS